MNEYKEYSAKTVDEAITAAICDLETSSENLEYEIIERGSNGFFGIGARPAVIKARKRDIPELDLQSEDKPKKNNKKKEHSTKQKERTYGESGKPENKSEASGKSEKKSEKPGKTEKKPETAKKSEKKPENSGKSEKQKKGNEHYNRNDEAELREESSVAGYEESDVSENINSKPAKEITPVDVTPLIAPAAEFLDKIFKAMGMEVKIDAKAGEEINTIEIELSGEEMGILIGKRGQTLDSLQYLTSIIVNENQSEYIRVKVDTEDYRSRRKETLENLARNIAAKVKRTNKSVTLEPMNPYERRIIHSVLQKDKYIDTHSEGEEPFRKVVVTPNKNCKEYSKNKKSYGNRGKYRK